MVDHVVDTNVLLVASAAHPDSPSGQWLQARAKLVRSDFVQGIQQHWSMGPLRRNTLAAWPSQ